MTDGPNTLHLPAARHRGLILREQLHQERLEGAARYREGQRQAKAALAPMLATIGKRITPAVQREQLQRRGKLRPPTKIEKDDLPRRRGQRTLVP